uniref:Uncharacterized protein n=1 Tax=Wuchereria bancrofti TaxID=6293 RepID=A0AAF5PJH3_WUCBA
MTAIIPIFSVLPLARND